jgi:hypothetical protein
MVLYMETPLFSKVSLHFYAFEKLYDILVVVLHILSLQDF